MDAEYLKHTVGDCLVLCLAEVCEKRPADPIEYIAHWLYKHVSNVKIKEKELEDALELERQRAEYATLQAALERQRLEQERITREDEERKRAEEASIAAAKAAEAALATLAEHEEEEEKEEEEEGHHEELDEGHAASGIESGMPVVLEQLNEEEELSAAEDDTTTLND
jgi:sRNA-binding protein